MLFDLLWAIAALNNPADIGLSDLIIIIFLSLHAIFTDFDDYICFPAWYFSGFFIMFGSLRCIFPDFVTLVSKFPLCVIPLMKKAKKGSTTSCLLHTQIFGPKTMKLNFVLFHLSTWFITLIPPALSPNMVTFSKENDINLRYVDYPEHPKYLK